MLCSSGFQLYSRWVPLIVYFAVWGLFGFVGIGVFSKKKISTNLWAVYKSGTGTRGRGHGTRVRGLGDARLGTWGRQVWDAGTCGTGTRGR